MNIETIISTSKILKTLERIQNDYSQLQGEIIMCDLCIDSEPDEGKKAYWFIRKQITLELVEQLVNKRGY